MASECVAVALSPESDFCLGKTYVVHFGASHNVSTVVRRRLPSGNEAVDVQIASRVCSEDSWISYWLCLVGGKVYVGVGKTPGEQCIGVMDDSLYNQLRSGVDAVRYVGLGNSALGHSSRPLKVRSVLVTTVPDTLRTTLEGLDTDNLPMVNIDAETDENAKAMMEEYEKECQKSKARAKKFGIPYKEPNPQAFLNWSKARRLRSNPQKGFATGMDIMSPEELEKQRKRAERFGTTGEKRERDGEAEEQEDDQQGMDTMEDSPLSVAEAWDNDELVRLHRTDPPMALWTTPSEDVVEEENYAMEETWPAKLTDEKIHIFSLDWSAFKQIRTDDIMAYFSSYGPSYIEWLGELSCNVHFEDRFSAARALQSLSQKLPSPPPEEVAAKFEDTPAPDFGSMGWAFCQRPIRKVANDRFGRRGTTARILMRVAASTDVLLQKPTSTPAPPPGFSTKRVLGPGSDFDTGHRQKRRKRESRNEEREEVNTYPEGDHPLLSQGLRCGRDGYSQEDMEAERSQDPEGPTLGTESEGEVPVGADDDTVAIVN
jgi:hypothetical protein